MEIFSALLAICAGNSPVTGEFPTQRPVTRSFDVYFDLRPNERLSKQSWGWWFETLSRSLWRHRNEKPTFSGAIWSKWGNIRMQSPQTHSRKKYDNNGKDWYFSLECCLWLSHLNNGSIMTRKRFLHCCHLWGNPLVTCWLIWIKFSTNSPFLVISDAVLVMWLCC